MGSVAWKGDTDIILLFRMFTFFVIIPRLFIYEVDNRGRFYKILLLHYTQATFSFKLRPILYGRNRSLESDSLP